MKYVYALIIYIVFSFTSNVSSLQNQENFLYSLTENENHYSIIATNPLDGTNQVIASIDKTQSGILPSVLPSSELSEVTSYLEELGRGADLNNIEAIVRVPSIHASPDGQQVIAEVYYGAWLPQSRAEFGVTNLVAINGQDGSQTVLFSQGFNDTQFLSEHSLYPRVLIREFEWIQDKQTLFVSISDTYYRTQPRNISVLRVLVADGSILKIDEGVDWTVSPAGDQLVILQATNKLPNTLAVVNLDPTSNAMTQSNYALDYWFIDKLVFAESVVVLSVALDSAQLEGGGGLAVFDLRSHTYSMEFPDQQALDIQSTPDKSVVMIESLDSRILQIVMDDEELQLEPVVENSVVHWNLGIQGDLLVQYGPDEPYRILNGIKEGIREAGAVLSTRELSNQDVLSNEQVIDLDW